MVKALHSVTGGIIEETIGHVFTPWIKVASIDTTVMYPASQPQANEEQWVMPTRD